MYFPISSRITQWRGTAFSVHLLILLLQPRKDKLCIFAASVNSASTWLSWVHMGPLKAFGSCNSCKMQPPSCQAVVNIRIAWFTHWKSSISSHLLRTWVLKGSPRYKSLWLLRSTDMNRIFFSKGLSYKTEWLDISGFLSEDCLSNT